MTTHHPLRLRKTLLILMCSCALLLVAPEAQSQDCEQEAAEAEAALTEIEAIANDIADQRDDCLTQSAVIRSARDTCKGQLKEVRKQASQLEDAHKTIAKLEARPKAWVWYSIGAGSGIVATMLTAFLITSSL
jgi:septal ring factor EnvC (AmiA/AmiB activator)